MARRPTTVFVDADDTLWFDEIHFTSARRAVLALLSPEDRDRAEREMAQMVRHCKPGEAGFVAMISSCVRQMQIEADVLRAIDQELAIFARHPVRVLASVRSVLASLFRYVELVLYTKGVREEQERKLQLSGLSSFFARVIVVKAKNEVALRRAFSLMAINPSSALVIGNSVRHDILPAVTAGGRALFLNHRLNFKGRNAPLPDGVPTFKRWKGIDSFVLGCQS